MKPGSINVLSGVLGATLSVGAWCQDGLGPQESDPERGVTAAVGIQIEDLEPAVDVSQRVPASASRGPVTAQAQPARSTGQVMDRLDLGTTSITGNRELPKVLYIVPWKRSDLGDLVGRPVNTLLDEVLAPVDPEVFERHLEYYDTLHGVSEEE